MSRCWALLAIGLAVVIFRTWLARDQWEYLRRADRSTRPQRDYLKLFRDQRAARFVILVTGLGVILIGLVCLAAKR